MHQETEPGPSAAAAAATDPSADIAWIKQSTVVELKALLAATMDPADAVVLASDAGGDAARIRAYLNTLPPVSIRVLLANAYMLVRSAFTDGALRSAFGNVKLRPNGDVRKFFNTVLIPTVDAHVAMLDRQR